MTEALKSSDVYTAIKSMKKVHEAESHGRSKVSPIIAVMPPSKEVVSSIGVDYINDTLQVNKVRSLCNVVRYVLLACHAFHICFVRDRFTDDCKKFPED